MGVFFTLVLTNIHMTGNKHPKAHLVGLARVAIYIIWSIFAHAYETIPGSIVILWFTFKAHMKWQK